MKKFWKTIKMLWYGMIYGMKATEDEMFHQSGISVDSGSTINQPVSEHSVAKALLRGELTQEVQELRYRTYKVSQEAKTYNYYSPKLAKKKNVNDYKYAEDSILKDDNREIITIQDNRIEVENVTDALIRMGDSIVFTEKPDKYHIQIIRGDDVFPRFKIENYITKIVVKQGDSEDTAVLDMYVSKYPNDKKKLSKPFIREVEKVKDGLINTDIFDIKSLMFETLNAYHMPDMMRFEFNHLKLETIIEYEGSYVIRFNSKIVDGGTDLTEEFYEPQMAKKYETKAKKELTINYDPNSEIRTYVCADCGKTVTYNAQKIEEAEASDEAQDTSYLEYFDYEVSQYDFGRMLCKDCMLKAQMELYKKIK